MSVNSKMTAIADAIRAKTKKTELLTLDAMATDIAGIDTSKPEQTKTATPSTSQQVIKPDSGYVLSQVTVNAMPTATQATPSISVDSAGKITASATQSAGYVAAGTKSATKQLTTQAAKTVTPSLSQQTAVASGAFTTGAVTVAPITSTLLTSLDADFKAENIAEGVNMFGVEGTMAGGAKVATGTATPSNDQITVTGLDFTPNQIYLMSTLNIGTSGHTISYVNGTYNYFFSSGYKGPKQGTQTLYNGGFTVMAGDSVTTGYLSGTYFWVAIGD